MGKELSGVGPGIAAGSTFGPWGAAIGGAVGLVGGIESANKAQSYEQQQQNALDADQAARQKYIEQQQATFQPIQQQMAQDAANPMPLNYGANLGNINAQTLQAQNHLGGVLASRGMTGSGSEAAGLQGLETGRVGELSQAFNTGMNARRQLGLNLLQSYKPLENAQFGEGALGQQMLFGADQQGIYNQGAQQGFAALGKGIAGMSGLQLPGGGGTSMPNAGGGIGVGDLNSDTQMALGENSTPYQSAMPQGWSMDQTGPMAQSQTSMPQGWDMSMSGGVPAETNGSGLNLPNMFAVQGAE